MFIQRGHNNFDIQLADLPTPSYTNAYSTQFDGIDDYVSTSVQNATLSTQTWSASVWVNWSALSGNNEAILSTRQNGIGTSKGIDLYMTGNNVLRARVYVGNGGYADITTTIPAIDTWYHAVITFASNTLKLYFDGVLIGSSVSVYTPSTNPLFIGKWGNGNNFHSGLIDEVGIFDIELTQENVTEIYNGGTPTDLSLLATPPIDWYRMGDNSDYKSPQWLLPSNENKDKVSNYSFELDGIDDYISTGLDLSFATVPNFSISYWIKTDATLTNFASYFAVAVNVTYGGAGGAYNYSAGRLYKSGSLGLLVYAQGSGSSNGSTALDDGNWHHIIQTYSDNGNNTSRVRIYVDGNTTPEVDLASTLSYAPLTSNLFIGARNASSDRAFPGNVDEVSVWNSVLGASDITALYNSGTPTTLPNGAVAHYRMGEDASFNGTDWTIPDNAGTNTGTSANMTVDDLVGEAPNYSGGGISSGMNIFDRVGEAPNSTSNSVSYNMDKEDRVEDTP